MVIVLANVRDADLFANDCPYTSFLVWLLRLLILWATQCSGAETPS